MPIYHYKGRNQQGEMITGQMEAQSSSDTASHLLNIGITPVDITTEAVTQTDVFASIKLYLRKRPDSNDLIMFSRQMSTLLRAGISILPALRGLKSHMTNELLSEALDSISKDLENGRSLAGSMQKHADIFPTLFISMVNVGENTGQLDNAFEQIYKYLEIDKETQDRIKAALRYPTFVIIAMVIALAIINLFVIPAFSSVFAGFGSDLPWATQLLMATSNFTTQYWHVLLLLVVISYLSIRAYFKTEEGKYQLDRYKLRLPLVGTIIERGTLARFSRAFSMAFTSGVPITQTLVIVSKAVDNTYLEKRILSMRDGLEHGESLTQTAVASNMFTPLVLQMISVGENSGSVDDMLNEVANFYEREVDYDTKKLSSAIEPILITVIGGMVLILALGVFLPMWDLAGVALGR
jgi:MSHA biogenesis protein MshG